MRLIETTDLTCIYGRDGERIRGLEGFSESFVAGEVTGLLGPNGAGKSTAMRIMTLGLRPQRGEIRWQGVPLLSAAERERIAFRRSFGYLPEFISLYMRLTGREYAGFMGELYGLSHTVIAARTEHLFARFKLAPDQDRYITGYSQGMLKKLALACTVLHDPKLLFLDEPTNSLDPLAIMELESFVRELADTGVTVIIASHNLHFVSKVCDRALFVHEGRVWQRRQTGLADNVDPASALVELESLYRETGQRDT